MSYKLYLDKPEEFVCEVQVKNASLKNSVARLIVESAEGINLVFNGKIEGEKCTVPIRRLKGLLDENAKGNMFLEVIVEDTYFKPWNDAFSVEEHTSVKVKVNENKQSNNKPIIEVKVPRKGKPVMNEKKNINLYLPLKELTNLCEKFDIKKSNFSVKKNDFRELVKEYFQTNPEFKKNKVIILNGLKNFLK